MAMKMALALPNCLAFDSYEDGPVSSPSSTWCLKLPLELIAVHCIYTGEYLYIYIYATKLNILFIEMSSLVIISN